MKTKWYDLIKVNDATPQQLIEQISDRIDKHSHCIPTITIINNGIIFTWECDLFEDASDRHPRS